MSATVRRTPTTGAPSLTRQDADRYVLAGGVVGTVDTTSITGRPVVAVAVDGTSVTDAELRRSPLGLEVSATVEQVPDLKTVTITIFLPNVRHELGEQIVCSGVALITTTHTGVAAQLLHGPLQTYEVRPVAVTANFVVS